MRREEKKSIVELFLSNPDLAEESREYLKNLKDGEVVDMERIKESEGKAKEFEEEMRKREEAKNRDDVKSFANLYIKATENGNTSFGVAYELFCAWRKAVANLCSSACNWEVEDEEEQKKYEEMYEEALDYAEYHLKHGPFPLLTPPLESDEKLTFCGIKNGFNIMTTKGRIIFQYGEDEFENTEADS